MSETATRASASAEARSKTIEARASPDPAVARLRYTAAAALVAILGGISTGWALAAMLAWSAKPVVVVIEPVAANDFDVAAASLVGPTAAAVIEAARSCRQPLAFVTIEATGEIPGTLRIRSGAYVSPNIKLGRLPMRLALPLPAPASTGAGDIDVFGDSGGAIVFLKPGVVIPAETHEKAIHVTWTPNIACKPAQ